MIEMAESASATGAVKTEETCVEVEEAKASSPLPPCSVCGSARGSAALAGETAAVLLRFAPALALLLAERGGCEGRGARACNACGLLLAALARAELELKRHKAAFDAVLARNPLLAAAVKPEPQASSPEELPSPAPPEDGQRDSEDEPLALTRQKRKNKKKLTTTNTKKQRKPTKKNSHTESCWNTTKVLQELIPQLDNVKKEDSLDGCESPLLLGLEGELKLELEVDFEGVGVECPKEAPLRPKAGARVRGRPRGAAGSSAPKETHQCDLCPNTYSSFKRLEQHREKHDKGPYICEVCGARYKHKRACDIHVALHRGISDWKCEECDKLFPSRGALQRHNNIHTGTPCYQCDQCGKSFIHTSSFKMHKLSHTGLKAHACAVCGLRLMTRSHLKRHARVHSGEKRHECALCGKRFSERYNLAAHARAHQAAGDQTPQPLPPRRRLFRCTYCPERFERRYMLERHTATVHGRTLERAPPTPRNTMSKLLKAQALGEAPRPAPQPAPQPAPPQPPAAAGGALKEERSPEARAPDNALKFAPPRLSGSWAGAFQEFGLRPFPH